MIANLIKRRVPHILGLYLGGAWVVVEFVSFLTERYLLADSVTDLVLMALLAMLPTVAVIAWFHGTPGKDEWVTAEKIVIPANLLFTAALLFFVFQGEELGATTTTITTTDERGETVTRIAPKQSFRKSFALFTFTDASGDDSLEWMQYGIPITLRLDLGQNPYVGVWSPLSGFEQSGLIDLQRAGFDDGLDVPLPLMRSIAAQKDLPLLLTGSYTKTGEELTIEAELYETDRGGKPRRLRASGSTFPDTVDELSRLVKEALDLPAGSDALGPDLPVSEHLSASPVALERFVRGIVAHDIRNDPIAAIELLRQAGEADPTFAAAHLHRAIWAINNGRTDAAVEALAAAKKHDYRLLPGNTFLLKALDYYLQDDVSGMISVYEMHSELYPENLEALRRLAFAYLFQSNEVDKALQAFETIRAKDPNATWTLIQIAQLRLVRGEQEIARELLLEYLEAEPEDYLPLLTLAQIDTQSGDLESARGHLERAVLLATGRVDPVLTLADLDLREGRFAAALRRFEDARGIAAVPRQEARVIAAELDYYYLRGMAAPLAERLDALFAVDSAYRGALNLLMTTVSDHVEHYLLAGMRDVYIARLEQLARGMEPPLNELVKVGYLGLYLEEGDIERAEEMAAAVRQLVERFGREDLEYLNDLATARIRQLKGDMDGAIEAAESSLARFDQSVHSVASEEDQILIRNMLGELHYRNGSFDAAVAVLDEVRAIFPAHPVTNLLLAEIATERGDPATARRFLDVSLTAWEQASDDHEFAGRARELAGRLNR